MQCPTLGFIRQQTCEKISRPVCSAPGTYVRDSYCYNGGRISIPEGNKEELVFNIYITQE